MSNLALFDEFFRGFQPVRHEREFHARADVRENDKAYVLSFDLPGMSKEDVQVEYDRGVLTVSGERKWEREEKDEGRYVCERQFGKFHRAFRLPETVDSERIEAEYRDGVLRVTVPKSEAARPRLIRIAG